MQRRLFVPFMSLVVSSLLGACSDSSKPTPTSGPVATLTVADGAQSTDSIPWPSDLFLDASGHVAPAALPLGDSAQTTSLLNDLKTTQDGFGVFTGAYFPVAAGSVDPASLTSHVHLYPLSCKNGAPLPADEIPVYIRLRSQDKPQRIYARPETGIVLREACTYAYVITRDVVTSDMGALTPSADLTALLADASPEPRLAHAHDVYAPLRTRLASGAVTAVQVAAATVFTTHSLTPDYLKGRAQLVAAPKPKATVTYIFARTQASGDDGSLEYLFGTPEVEQPGMDNLGGVSHTGIDYVVQGTFQTIDFLGGTTKNAIGIDATVVGQVEYDANGPKAKGMINVPFTLVIPTGADLTNLKYAVVQHGLGAERMDMITVANTLAVKGIASILIDLPFHGGRSPAAVDKVFAMTGVMGPDGFAETDANPSFGFFSLNGNPGAGIPNLSPRSVRSHFFQAVNDIERAFLLMSTGDLSAIGAKDARLTTLHFDATAEAYVGESFGSMIGTIVSAFEPKLVATVLDVGGGGTIFPLLLNSAEFAPLFGTLLDSNLGANAAGGNDPADTDWAYNLAEMLLDGGDSLAFSPYVVAQQTYSATADSPCHVLQLSAWHDEVVPNPANIALARGLGLTPLTLSDGVAPDVLSWAVTPATGMLSGNGAGGRTAAFVQFHDAIHVMMTERKGNHNYDLSKGVPPFPTLTTPVPVDNPIDRIHAIVGSFVDAALKGQVPKVQ